MIYYICSSQYARFIDYLVISLLIYFESLFQTQQFWLFMTILSLFFHSHWPCVLFASILQQPRSSVIPSFHVLCSLYLPFFIFFLSDMELLDTFIIFFYTLRRLKDSLGFKGENFSCEYIVERLTFSYALIAHYSIDHWSLISLRNHNSSLHFPALACIKQYIS